MFYTHYLIVVLKVLLWLRGKVIFLLIGIYVSRTLSRYRLIFKGL